MLKPPVPRAFGRAHSIAAWRIFDSDVPSPTVKTTLVLGIELLKDRFAQQVEHLERETIDRRPNSSSVRLKTAIDSIGNSAPRSISHQFRSFSRVCVCPPAAYEPSVLPSNCVAGIAAKVGAVSGLALAHDVASIAKHFDLASVSVRPLPAARFAHSWMRSSTALE